MPQDTIHPLEGAIAGTNGHRLPSLDFGGKKELNWSAIETALHQLFAQGQAIEVIGRGAADSVHGESLAPVFEFLADAIEGRLNDLWDLLGLARRRFGNEHAPRHRQFDRQEAQACRRAHSV